MRRDLELESRIVEKRVAEEPYLDESGRRRWTGAESQAIDYGGVVGDGLIAHDRHSGPSGNRDGRV